MVCIIHTVASGLDENPWTSPPLPASSCVRAPVPITRFLTGVALYFLGCGFISPVFLLAVVGTVFCVAVSQSDVL
jgi:hypothetical protein